MNRDTQLAILDRALTHAQAGTTDVADAGFAQPAEAYLDPARFERERRILFHRGPSGLAHASELRRPGDFVTRDLADLPLLLVRDEQGRLGGFLNACRHRGMRLATAPCGQERRLTCPYHAWTYALSGELRGIPHQDGFRDLPAEHRALRRVPVAEAGGFVFASGPGGVADPALGPLAPELDGLGLGQHQIHGRRSEVRPLNWKLVFDIFLEAYHLRTTHRASVAPMFFDNVFLVDHLAPHLRTTFVKRSIVELVGRPRAEWQLRPHTNLVYILFPSTLILLDPDHAMVLHVVPLSIDRTRVDSYSLVPDAELSDKARLHYDKSDALVYRATDEDYAMGEAIQRNLATGATRTLWFGRFEHALVHFHRAIDAALAAADEPPADTP